MITIGPDFRPPPTIGPFQIAFLELWIDTIVQLDREYGGTWILTSWYRDPMRNTEVGGKAMSLHLVGLGGDFVVERSILRDAFCGLGSLVGLCKELPIFAIENRYRRRAPPYTQAVLEPNGSYHYELDLTP